MQHDPSTPLPPRALASGGEGLGLGGTAAPGGGPKEVPPPGLRRIKSGVGHPPHRCAGGGRSRELRAPDIELLFKAARQLLLTPPELWPQDPPIEEFPGAIDVDGAIPLSPRAWTAFRHHLVRHLSNVMGQPARCGRAACRRNQRCSGEPPDCWPDIPPLETDEEVAFVQYVMKTLLQEAGAEAGAAD